MKNNLFLLLIILASTQVKAQNIMNETVDVKVCFTADHTWVSDLGFYLLAPGGDTIEPGNHGVVQLLPSASNWGPDATFSGWTGIPFSVLGCTEDDENTTCQSGNDLVDLCFTSTLPASDPSQTLCVCDAQTPLTGDYASVEAWDSVFGYPLIAPWGVAIADCEQIDIGELIAFSIEFTLPSGGVIQYEMTGGTSSSSFPILDKHCSLDSATRVYMMSDSLVDLHADLTTQSPIPENTTQVFATLDLFNETDVMIPFYTIDSIEMTSYEILGNTCEANYLIHQGEGINNQSFNVNYDMPSESLDIIDFQLNINWTNTNSGANMMLNVNHLTGDLPIMFTDDKNSSEIKVYPNPITTKAFVELNHHGEYKLFSPNGGLIQSGTLKQGKNTLNIKQLPSGQYLLHIFAEGQFYQRQLIVK